MKPISLRQGRRRSAAHSAAGSVWVRGLLCGAALVVVSALLVVPLVAVFVNALSAGVSTYFKNISHPDTVSAIELTLLTAAIAVPLNAAFGIVAAWLIAKFDFRGKQLLVTIIDLPFSAA